MKRKLSHWTGLRGTGVLGMGLLALAMVPALAQTPAPAAPATPAGPTGKIHGHVTNPPARPKRRHHQPGWSGPGIGPGLTAKTSDKGTITVDATANTPPKCRPEPTV